ncbi:uncharacterized protein LOC129606896 isoform X2 [Condylostylus longicornis]|uniref:uncharacterized protein LOC129606896 isoform X2 n=1 Tax=Condylostylus longicornis TaxID=2530218 RepID=UPI00244E49ED|nr:uncharacterized protein LOC129606896 isoform X2 [Condylostylus longicornis]
MAENKKEIFKKAEREKHLKDSICKSTSIEDNKQKQDPLVNLYELSKTLSLHDFENEIIKYPEGEIFTQASNDLRLRSSNTTQDFPDDQSEKQGLNRNNLDERNSKKMSLKYKAAIPSSNTKTKQLASKFTYQIIAFTLIAVSIIAVCLVAICGYNIYLSDEKKKT